MNGLRLWSIVGRFAAIGLVVGCAKEATPPVPGPAGRNVERARPARKALDETTVRHASSRWSPDSVEISMPAPDGPVVMREWSDGNRTAQSSLVYGDGKRSLETPPSGFDPRRENRIVLKSTSDAPPTLVRTVPLRIPAGKPNWSASRPLRARDGGWTARLRRISLGATAESDALELELTGTAPVPGWGRATDVTVRGRWDRNRPLPVDVPANFRLRGTPESPRAWIPLALFRSGDRMEITVDLVAGPMREGTVRIPFRMDRREAMGRLVTTPVGSPFTGRSSLVTIRQAWTPGQNSLEIALASPSGDEKSIDFARQAGSDDDWRRLTKDGGSYAPVRYGADGTPTDVEVRMRRLEIRSRERRTFFLVVP